MSEFLHQSSKALILWLSLAFCGSSAFAMIQRYSPLEFSKDESLFFIGCLWALCVVGFLRCLKKQPEKTGKKKSVDYSNVLRVTIINLCLSFSLMGGALFVYPLVKLTTAKDIVLFLLTMVYFIPHSFLLYVAIENLCKATATQLSHVERKMSKKQLLLRFSLYFFAIYAICLLYNLAYNPSIMFWDSYYQVAQAKGVLPYDNWHPLFTTFMIQGLLKINDSLSFVVLMQDVYWTAVLAGIAFWFAVRTNRWVLPVSCAMLFTLMPNQGLAVATILKDVPYMATLLWLTFILFRLIVEGNRWIHRKIFYFEIVTALTVITLVRTNGFVASVCVACCLFVITKYKKQMAAALGCVH